MTPVEWRAATALAGIFSLRMLGLFMILPVFALYAEELQGATPLLAGLAIGAYGLTQALLQIPYGLMSDRYGRHRVMAFGLLVFALGSVVAAMADNIWWVIAGRALQGAGAIAAVVMATAADLTREEHRTKAMALIGMSIGVSFSAALVLGPVLNRYIGVPGIFWLTGVLACVGIGVLYLAVPKPEHSIRHRDAEAEPGQLGLIIRDGQLLRLDFGILTLHMILTASFVVLPLILRDQLGLASDQHWKVYLPVLLLSVIIMVPFLIIAERRRLVKPFFAGAVLVLAVAEFGLARPPDSVWMTGAFLLVFYTGFNFLEASLPSLISRMAPAQSKGTAMGVYSSSQFAGAFLGGIAGGWLHGSVGLYSVFLFSALAALVWFGVALTMRGPRYLTHRLLHVGTLPEEEARRLGMRLLQVQGVAEAEVIAAEGTAYLKVDKAELDEETLNVFAKPD